ncbi:P-loop NTPase family protein [Pseudodesulfovibrio piezophilus]|uniref:Tyrosine-protein kinase n=1 Tax=Pseudodesulfovibrio piezophilus (strain DSM 21447 / JCM 15486 / C1TLV30) TaxID=1322246 RepID=M1WSC7_PSEP2|nr:tyrosine protein kinase [Pseudodesulfovibrio piezophilus]CCH50109.1 Tyrosine-protein kinase [Pseudodesulfovibrio piezophilus C1TLV30]
MSKIAKALQKAQDERNDILEQVSPSSPSMSSDKEKTEEATVRHNYRMTQIQEADDLHLERNRLLTSGSAQYIRDSFNVLRARILQITRTDGLNSIMVTSPRRKEGKTIVATNLAMSLARDARQTALLVDTNLRWPGVATTMGVCRGQEGGLEEYLIGHLELPELLVNPGIDKLVVLPACRATTESADLLSTPKMQQLVKECKSRYPDRYVIFDCPHIIDMPDSLVFSTYVDGVILVVEEGKTSQEDIRASLEMLSEANILGVVLNKHFSQ